jgi:3-phytase
MRPAAPSLVVVLALTLLAGCGGGGGQPQQQEVAEQRERDPQPRHGQHTVVPTVETTPVSHSGDAADDAAIWVNPSDPARSTIIGTHKLGGITVYDLAGTQLQYRDENATYNNVDLRTDFPLGDQRVALVAASDRTRYYTSDRTQYHRRIVLYSVDPASGTLTDPVGTIRADFEPYGLCMYRSQTSGSFYVFVTGRNPVGDLDGYVEQWELSDNGRGQIDAEKVRSFGVGSLTEGCVADDEMGHLYLAEEDVGIWKYPAEPNEELDRLLVDAAGPEGHLVADVEGLGDRVRPQQDRVPSRREPGEWLLHSLPA